MKKIFLFFILLVHLQAYSQYADLTMTNNKTWPNNYTLVDTLNSLTAGNGCVVNVTGTLVVLGNFTANNNVTLNITGNLIINGNVIVSNNAVLQVNGSVDVGGDLTSGNGQNITVNGDMNIDGNVNTGNGTISGTGEVVVGGTFTSTGSTTVEVIEASVQFTSTTGSGSETTSAVSIPVVLSETSSRTITVNYSITGTATSGSDFTLTNGTLTFNPGETSKNISLTVLDDNISEANETVIITLSNPNNSILGVNTQFTYTIIDYNQQAGAKLISNTSSWCSSNAIYSNSSATADGPATACWSGGVGNNVWFKFVALNNKIKVDIKTGSSFGTMRGQQVAIYREDGTLVVCMDAGYNYAGTLTLSTDTLTAGHSYYISVDDQTTHGTFTLCLDNSVTYDYKSGAVVLSDITSWCSADAIYNNIYATADGPAAACWSGGVTNNVWFKFVALNNNIKVDIKTGSTFGTMRGQQVAIYREDGTLVACMDAGYNYAGTLTLSTDTLTAGHTYYISVDDRTTRGTFSLCIDNTVTYDYKSGAVVLSDITSWCSADAIYDNIYATTDGPAAACWSGGVTNNVWFKFVALNNNIKVDIKTGSTFGTMRGQQVAIYREDGTLVACMDAGYNYAGTLTLSTDTLTAGHTYYISVDDRTTRGTFTICLDNTVTYDYISGAISLDDITSWCSSDAIYDNIYATSDGYAAACWSGGVTNNVWFKFVALNNNIKVDIKTGSTFGTMRGQQVAIYREDGTLVACMDAGYNYAGALTLSTDTLTAGHTYYISVDDRTTRGTFTLCLDNTVTYDYYSGAIVLEDVNEWCSSDAIYDNIYATADGVSTACWSGGVTNNVWFKWKSITRAIEVEVKTGATFGTMRGQQVAVFNEKGILVACMDAGYNFAGTLTLSTDTLTAGHTYYISVDDRTTRGTFSLCVNDRASYDFKNGALSLTDPDNWCSSNAEYSNTYATSDESAGSCWSGGTSNNVWYKFTATFDTATIQVKTGSGSGTMRGQQIALWNSSGVLVKCMDAGYNFSGTLTLTANTLTVGDIYYISVDDRTTHGTFSLCFNNVSNNKYYAIADGDWSNPNVWSKTVGGVTSGTVPSSKNVANIKGYNVTVSSDVSCAGLNIVTQGRNTSLSLVNGKLNIGGKLYIENNSNYNLNLNVSSSAQIDVISDCEILRSGGNKDLIISLEDNSLFNVGRDLILRSTGGTVTENNLLLNDFSRLYINRDLILNYSAGTKIKNIINDNSLISVGRNISYISNAENTTEIELNGNSIIYISRNFVRGTTPYGRLNCYSNSKVVFNSSIYQQIIPNQNGIGTDGLNLKNIQINNTYGGSPQIILESNFTLSGELKLTRSIIKTSDTKLLTVASTGLISGASSISFIDGPVKKIGNTEFTFPIGEGSVYAPIKISAPLNVTSEFTAKYSNGLYSNTTSKQDGVDNVSIVEYWDLNRNVGASPDDDVYVTLFWQNGARSGISNIDSLLVVHWNGSEWESLGGGDKTGSSSSGSITTKYKVNNFSPFTFGSTNSENNPLPIELISFTAKVVDNTVELSWATASEINNDYFTIEKSKDNKNYEVIEYVDGAGSSFYTIVYKKIDYTPYEGISYYRLKQTDYDGNETNSNVVSVDNSKENEQILQFDKLYYDYTNGLIVAEITNSVADNKIKVKVLNSSGVNLIEKDYYLLEGKSKILIPTNELPNGVYIVNIYDNRNFDSRKFAK